MKKILVFLLISLLYFSNFSCSKASRPSLKKGQGSTSTKSSKNDIFSFFKGSSNRKSVSTRRGRINIERWINDNFILAVGTGAIIILMGYVIYQNRRGARRRV